MALIPARHAVFGVCLVPLSRILLHPTEWLPVDEPETEPAPTEWRTPTPADAVGAEPSGDGGAITDSEEN